MADAARMTEEDKNEFYNDYVGNVEGELSVPKSSSSEDPSRSFDTLDEPIKATFLRDLKAVGTKFVHVLYPKHRSALLRDWDLWGPLILCVLLAMMLQTSDDDTFSDGPQFAQVFVIVWIGSVVVTLNSKLLGGKLSFFQSICVLGYCLLPPVLALIICKLLLIAFREQTLTLFIVRFFVTMFGFSWATFASMAFLGNSQPPQRKALVVYPICLFYFVISWLIISHTHSS